MGDWVDEQRWRMDGVRMYVCGEGVDPDLCGLGISCLPPGGRA